MIISGLLDVIILLLKAIITPISVMIDVPGVTDAISSAWNVIGDFLDMIESGFSFAAYFFHWEIIKGMALCFVIVETAFHTYKLIYWIYRNVPFIH